MDKFLFRVENAFLKNDTGFRDMGEIGCDITLVEHYQGGSLLPDLGPGLGKMTTVTLRRGATQNNVALEGWFQRVLNSGHRFPLDQGGGLGVGGANETDFKCPTRVLGLDRAHNVVTTWVLHDAFPIGIKFEGFDNTANERAIESITLAFLSYERLTSSGVKINLQVGFPGIGGIQVGNDGSSASLLGRTIPFLGSGI